MRLRVYILLLITRLDLVMNLIVVSCLLMFMRTTQLAGSLVLCGDRSRLVSARLALIRTS